MSLPFVVHEKQLKVFNFYLQGSIYQATFFRQQLYRFYRLFDFASRTAAYRLSCTLSDQGDPVLITVSLDGYKIWVNLRSQTPPEPIIRLPHAASPGP